LGTANILCGEKSPDRIEPAGIKVGQNSVEPQPEVSFDVLGEDEGGLDLVEDAGDRGPEVSRIIGAPSPSRVGKRLAWIARRDEVHRSTPRAAFEGVHIRPARRRSHARFFAARSQ